MTSRQMKDHTPVWTKSSAGPRPTSVTATVERFTSSPKLWNGQTLSGSQPGRGRGTLRAEDRPFSWL